MSHKLNSEVQYMVSTKDSLQITITSIYDTLMNYRKRLRNRAMLRNLARFSPITPNATRWSGLCRMHERFCEIPYELLIVADLDAATITIDISTAFMHKSKKYPAMLLR